MTIRTCIAPALTGIFLLVNASGSSADVWQREPSYGVELGFNDNYTLKAEPESDEGTRPIQAVSTVKANAELSLKREKPAFSTVVTGRLIATSYAGDTEGYWNPRANDNAGAFEGAKLEPRLDGALELGMEGRQLRATWKFNASMVLDSLLQDINLDADTLNEADNNVGVARENVVRTRIAIAPSYAYKVTEVSDFTADMLLATVAYTNTENTSLSDAVDLKLNASYSRGFSPVSSWFVDGGFQSFQTTDASESSTFSAGVGIEHKLSETIDLRARVAQSTGDFNFGTEFGETKGNAKRPLVELKATKETARSSYTLRLGSNLHGSAGGEVVAANELLLNVRHQVSDLMTLTLRNKFFENTSLREELSISGEHSNAYNLSIEEANRRYLAFEPSINWRFSRWWVMDSGLRYQREKRFSNANPGESTYVFVGVTYSKPIEVAE